MLAPSHVTLTHTHTHTSHVTLTLTLTLTQRVLDEFDYTVHSLASDLRDGLRLT